MMMSRLTALLLVFSIFVCVSYGSDVVDLDPTSFKKEVLESEIIFLVEFFAPWCGHCQRLAPEWEKAATNLKGIVSLGKVDCTVHQNLCGQYQVQGYPTIKVFSEKGKKVTDYQQARQAGAIVRFATDELPNLVVRIKDTTSLANFLQQNPEIPHLILFTSKADISPIMKSLSASYKGKVLFGQVKQDVKDVVQKYNVESFPQVIVVKDQEAPVLFDGNINPEELRKFVSGFADETVTVEPVPPPPPPPHRARPSKAATDVSFIEITTENIDTVCAGLCVLGFVNVEPIEEKRVVEAEDQKLLDGILSSFKSDGKFKFGWVDISNNQELTKKFSITSKTLLVFNGKRQRYVKSPDFDFKIAFTTVEHVLTGDAQYTSL